MSAATALAAIPAGLRVPLLTEYQSIVQNYSEHRWSPSELSGGKFCEIVFTILHGHASAHYAASPTKPSNFVGACKQLENNAHVPRSFQILIPRILPALYEVRNNRGVGHVGGDVDPNHMDAIFVLSSCNWIMAELVRVYHDLSTGEAQRLVDSLVERRIPLIWEADNMRRVLDPAMTLRSQVLLLLSTTSGTIISTSDLLDWTGYGDRAYFRKLLRQMHTQRMLELSADQQNAQILPPGSAEAAENRPQQDCMIGASSPAASKRRIPPPAFGPL
jgi:hypothetical protein